MSCNTFGTGFCSEATPGSALPTPGADGQVLQVVAGDWASAALAATASSFTPAVAGDWSPSPSTAQGALDQLGARVQRRRTGQTAAFTSGVTFTLWSYTLAEGEVMSANYAMTGGSYSAGVTLRTYAYFNFSASRSVGGVAAVSTGSGQEIGSISGGTISITTSGNDVLVRMVYTASGTLTFNDSVLLESIMIPQV